MFSELTLDQARLSRACRATLACASVSASRDAFDMCFPVPTGSVVLAWHNANAGAGRFRNRRPRRAARGNWEACAHAVQGLARWADRRSAYWLRTVLAMQPFGHLASSDFTAVDRTRRARSKASPRRRSLRGPRLLEPLTADRRVRAIGARSGSLPRRLRTRSWGAPRPQRTIRRRVTSKPSGPPCETLRPWNEYES